MTLPDLIQRSVAGDQAAFGLLFEQYKNLVYRTAFLLLDDAHESEEVLQEVFLKVYQALDTYNPTRAAFTTWLHRITVNHCLNHRRKFKPVLEPLESAAGETAADAGIEDQVAEGQVFRAALQRLSPRLRAVVVLRYYHDLSYAEVAQVLEIPLGTVQSRLNLALKQVQQELLDNPSQSIPGHEVTS